MQPPKHREQGSAIAVTRAGDPRSGAGDDGAHGACVVLMHHYAAQRQTVLDALHARLRKPHLTGDPYAAFAELCLADRLRSTAHLADHAPPAQPSLVIVEPAQWSLAQELVAACRRYLPGVSIEAWQDGGLAPMPLGGGAAVVLGQRGDGAETSADAARREARPGEMHRDARQTGQGARHDHDDRDAFAAASSMRGNAMPKQCSAAAARTLEITIPPQPSRAPVLRLTEPIDEGERELRSACGEQRCSHATDAGDDAAALKINEEALPRNDHDESDASSAEAIALSEREVAMLLEHGGSDDDHPDHPEHDERP